MGIVKLEDYGQDVIFWEIYPRLKEVGVFKEVFACDKSPNKKHSSKKMWAVAFIWDSASEFFNLPEDPDDEDSKIRLVFEDYVGDFSVFTRNKETIYRMKDFYLKLHETPAKRSLRELEEQLEERSKFMKSIVYDMGTFNENTGKYEGGTVDTKEKMMANNDKVYSMYDKALKTVQDEDLSDGRKKGDGEMSLIDKNEI